MSADEALSRAEKLLEKVEEARQQLEHADDSAQAIEILSRLSELAKEVEAELSRARREAEAEADAGA